MRGAKARYTFGNDINKTALKLGQISARQSARQAQIKQKALTEQQKVTGEWLEDKTNRYERWGETDLDVIGTAHKNIVNDGIDLIDGFQGDISHATVPVMSASMKKHDNYLRGMPALNDQLGSALTTYQENNPYLTSGATEYLKTQMNQEVTQDWKQYQTTGESMLQGKVDSRYVNHFMTNELYNAYVDMEAWNDAASELGKESLTLSSRDAYDNASMHGVTGYDRTFTTGNIAKEWTSQFDFAELVAMGTDGRGFSMETFTNTAKEFGMSSDQVQDKVFGLMKEIMSDEKMMAVVDARGEMMISQLGEEGVEYNRGKHGQAVLMTLLNMGLDEGNEVRKEHLTASKAGGGYEREDMRRVDVISADKGHKSFQIYGDKKHTKPLTSTAAIGAIPGLSETVLQQMKDKGTSHVQVEITSYDMGNNDFNVRLVVKDPTMEKILMDEMGLDKHGLQHKEFKVSSTSLDEPTRDLAASNYGYRSFQELIDAAVEEMKDPVYHNNPQHMDEKPSAVDQFVTQNKGFNDYNNTDRPVGSVLPMDQESSNTFVS